MQDQIIVLTPPLFAVRHCEAALQLARGRVQAERAKLSAKEQAAKDQERALRLLVGRARA
jgi:hypothetical protein